MLEICLNEMKDCEVKGLRKLANEFPKINVEDLYKLFTYEWQRQPSIIAEMEENGFKGMDIFCVYYCDKVETTYTAVKKMLQKRPEEAYGQMKFKFYNWPEAIL